MLTQNKNYVRFKSGTSRSQVEHSTTEPMNKTGMISGVWVLSYMRIVNAQTSMHGTLWITTAMFITIRYKH